MSVCLSVSLSLSLSLLIYIHCTFFEINEIQTLVFISMDVMSENDMRCQMNCECDARKMYMAYSNGNESGQVAHSRSIIKLNFLVLARGNMRSESSSFISSLETNSGPLN